MVVSFQLVSGSKLSELKLFALIAVLLLVINITGDHVFNKVNNLKVFLVLICIIPLSICTLIYTKIFNIRLLGLLLLPILATLPGAMLSRFQFSYGLPFELISQVLCVIWAFLLFSAVQSQKIAGTWKVLWVFIPTIYFVCLVAFLEKLGLSPLLNIHLNPFEASTLSEPWQYQGVHGRVESTFGNINYFANFLIQVLPITVALFLIINLQIKVANDDSRILSSIVLLSGAFVLLALAITETRSAIIAAVISMAIFSWLLIKINILSRQLVIRFGLLALVLMIAIMLSKIGLETDRFSVLLKKETWWPRTVPWKTAWDSFKSTPLFGYGAGASYQLFFEYIAPDSRLFSGSRSYNHVHNEILQILQEGGIFGLAVYLAFWIIPIWLGMKCIFNTQRPIEIKILVSALISGLLAFHIHGLFSVAPRMISGRLIAYSLLAILLAVLWNQQDEHSGVTVKRGNKAFTLTALSFSIVIIFTYLVPFLHGKFQYVSALIHPDRKAQLIKLTDTVDDIYILEASAKEAFDNKQVEPLLEITRKASTVFPHYREMAVYHAYGLYWKGDVDGAYLEATNYQVKDHYSPLVNTLLLGISIERSSDKELLTQLTKTLEYQACKNHLMACEALNITVVSGRFALPFQILDKGDEWNVLLDKSFLMSLRALKQNTLNNNKEGQRAYRQLLRLVSGASFFRPEAIISEPLTETDYSNLTRYLAFLNNDMKQDPQKLILKGMLDKKLHLEEFLKKRAFLMSLSNTLLNAIKLSDISVINDRMLRN